MNVDASQANLAGAVGVPLWVMVEQDCDWRWGIEGESTPWFPCTKIFRQDGRGWLPVIERVRAQLKGAALAQGSGSGVR